MHYKMMSIHYPSIAVYPVIFIAILRIRGLSFYTSNPLETSKSGNWKLGIAFKTDAHDALRGIAPRRSEAALELGIRQALSLTNCVVGKIWKDMDGYGWI